MRRLVAQVMQHAGLGRFTVGDIAKWVPVLEKYQRSSTHAKESTTL
jgi:hypothetical protein